MPCLQSAVVQSAAALSTCSKETRWATLRPSEGSGDLAPCNEYSDRCDLCKRPCYQDWQIGPLHKKIDN